MKSFLREVLDCYHNIKESKAPVCWSCCGSFEFFGLVSTFHVFVGPSDVPLEYLHGMLPTAEAGSEDGEARERLKVLCLGASGQISGSFRS